MPIREGHATRIDYHDPDGNPFAVTIELVNQIVLISLAEQRRLDEEAEQPPEVNIAGRFARMIGLH